MDESSTTTTSKGRFGTLPVFFTAISTILGAILFLRFGYAVGNLGFYQTILIVLIGHMVTIPTAMAIAEIATNQKVEGGGEYFIISRSFGLNIGSAIGIALFFSQAISVAFYLIAFGEAFQPVYYWLQSLYDLPMSLAIFKKQVSLLGMVLLSALILTKGASVGLQALYVVVAVLFMSLVAFFLGNTGYAATFEGDNILNNPILNGDPFFMVFAICFPAFTGMTAGVGLSGDLRDPKRSIPLGTLAGTLCGMVMYVLIAYKLATSASAEALATDQFAMGNIAEPWGVLIPIGLACATVSSALGSVLVAPRTLQAIASDRIFPSPKVNDILTKGKGKNNEPFNSSLVVIFISFIIIAAGNVDFVAEIITMFFMVTYGSLCLISFLQHFNADPSYRPAFKSRWYISLFGALMCIWLMFKINFNYALAAVVVMILLYLGISYYRKGNGGIASIFQGAMFQMNRSLRVYLQKADKQEEEGAWRPSVICVSRNSFDRFTAFDLLRWISFKYGFGTYIHQIEGYYSKNTHQEAKKLLDRLLEVTEKDSNVYIDTLISPSYTSAIAQSIQLPGVSGKDNNMILFEFLKREPKNLTDILDNYQLVKAGEFDVLILGSSQRAFAKRKSIHIWIKPNDYENANLMILLGYIISGHKEWNGAIIKIFSVFPTDQMEEQREKLQHLIQEGRLPISMNNIEVLQQPTDISVKELINVKSKDASLTILGFRSESVKNQGAEYFEGFGELGSILFVNSSGEKVIR